jgi:uncharacterized membrane protein (DUF2068 family)
MLSLEVPPEKQIPQAVDEHSSKTALRAVATFEAAKGIVVLILGLALVAIHSHVEEVAENLLYQLHIDFDRRLGHLVLSAAATLNSAKWWTIGAAVGAYSSVRFIEAWGLWNRRVWAEWFALLSGAMYLPWEFLKIMERADWDRITVLVINLVIVLYMTFIRISEHRGKWNREESSPSQ